MPCQLSPDETAVFSGIGPVGAACTVRLTSDAGAPRIVAARFQDKVVPVNGGADVELSPLVSGINRLSVVIAGVPEAATVTLNEVCDTVTNPICSVVAFDLLLSFSIHAS